MPGLGFGASGSWALGLKVEVCSSKRRPPDSGFVVCSLRVWVMRVGFEVGGLGCGVWCLGFGPWG